jgi:hypothetical protein
MAKSSVHRQIVYANSVALNRIPFSDPRDFVEKHNIHSSDEFGADDLIPFGNVKLCSFELELEIVWRMHVLDISGITPLLVSRHPVGVGRRTEHRVLLRSAS